MLLSRLCRAELVSTSLALRTTSYLSQETEYMPWQSALDNLGYYDLMLDRTEVYEPMQVQRQQSLVVNRKHSCYIIWTDNLCPLFTFLWYLRNTSGSRWHPSFCTSRTWRQTGPMFLRDTLTSEYTQHGHSVTHNCKLRSGMPCITFDISVGFWWRLFNVIHVYGCKCASHWCSLAPTTVGKAKKQTQNSIHQCKKSPQSKWNRSETVEARNKYWWIQPHTKLNQSFSLIQSPVPSCTRRLWREKTPF